jgi:6-pyruvoyltetrahydropterin/6-carboxytetrahydropterin synthase
MICIRDFEFDAGHRLMDYDGPCANIHGHRYKVEIHVKVKALDSLGIGVDFGVLKVLYGGWIDGHWDHALLLNAKDQEAARSVCPGQKLFLMNGNPTAENMAMELLRQFGGMADPLLVKVVVWETPTCRVEVTRDDL